MKVEKTVKERERDANIERAVERFYLREAVASGDRRGADKARTLARRHGRLAKREVRG
jgi:hypothetical protein